MPLSATFINIFDINCLRCRLTTIQDVCEVSSVTVCFNSVINPGIPALSELNPEIHGWQKRTGPGLHSLWITVSTVCALNTLLHRVTIKTRELCQAV